ncbi:alpha-glucuronidase [Sphingomonas sp. PvP055]
MSNTLKRGLFACLLASVATPALAEDGYDLWLRYHPLATSGVIDAATVAVLGDTPTLKVAGQEVQRGLAGLSAHHVQFGTAIRSGGVVLALATEPRLQALGLKTDALGSEGYLVRSVDLDGRRVTLVTANSDHGVLYGAFALLRWVQTGHPVSAANLTSTPHIALRVLDHWDNLDGTVERGYSGQSLWDWWTLPDYRDPRYTDYARANASIGINGSVLNNVNAKADSLTPFYIAKAAALADIFRPYGIKVYLSARFSAPIELGGLKTADPLDPAGLRHGGAPRRTKSTARSPILAASS